LAFHLPTRGRIHKVDGTLEGGAQPIHQPDVVLARRGVAPQDVGLAVAVEVADPVHLPGLVAHKLDRAPPDDGDTDPPPDLVLPGRRVAPPTVVPYTTLFRSLAFHLPTRGRIHKVDGTLEGGAQPVHQPDVVLAGRGVAPQDVGLAVAVEVADPVHLPGL